MVSEVSAYAKYSVQVTSGAISRVFPLDLVFFHFNKCSSVFFIAI